MQNLLVDKQRDGVAIVTLNRPKVHNAFDDALIADLSAALRALDVDAEVRLVVLSASGTSFSAGADLNWMRRMAGYSHEQNLSDAIALAGVMRTLNCLSKPTIARVQGPAYGGGVGLVACCDLAVASKDAAFSLSEVKLGIIPAVISPYVVAAIGERMARRYFLTGERFDASEAYRIGLVHELVQSEEALDEMIEALVAALLSAGPAAQTEAKQLIDAVANRPLTDEVVRDTAERIARVRASPEGREGIGAFLAKQKPAWVKRGGEE